MRNSDRKRLFGIAALSAGLLFLGTAYAWYGDPWYRPYGSGAVTYERQNMMRQHGYAMDQLADMLQGRHLLNRDEAVRLARELEAGFGDDLIRNFPPGTVVAGSRTSPRTWRYFGAFRNNAEAAKQAAARLADALEDEPSMQDFQQLPPLGSRRRIGFDPRGHRPGGPVSIAVNQEFDRLNATCTSCHMLFRGWRR